MKICKTFFFYLLFSSLKDYIDIKTYALSLNKLELYLDLIFARINALFYVFLCVVVNSQDKH